MTTATISKGSLVRHECDDATYVVLYTMADGHLVHIRKVKANGEQDRRSGSFTAHADRLTVAE